MSATWMVLLYGDEQFWASATPEVSERVMGEHGAFSEACAERGYKILGGEELGFTWDAFTARRPDGGPVAVSEGPYIETAEHLGGYYVVETDDGRGLARLAGDLLLTDGGGAEVRPVILHP